MVKAYILNVELNPNNERSYILDGIKHGRYSENVILVPRNHLLDLLFDVLDGHLVLLLTKRDELLIRHFADLILSKVLDHGVQNLVDGGTIYTDLLLISILFQRVYDHIFQCDVFFIRRLLRVD